ncbi:MAG: AMP-binding protein [Hyphomicrobiales bacterium]|nr:AMP-binding protein [Hyphomicrobiales bacterium]
MLEGCTAWPEAFAARYRREGYWPDLTLCDMLDRSIGAAPQRTALVCGTRRLNYAQLGQAIEGLAAKLFALGLRSSDRVVFQLPNSIEFFIAFFALLRIGVIPVLALPAHRREEISHFVAHAEAVGYFVPDVWHGYDYRPLAADLARCAPTLRHVFVLGEPGPGQISLPALLADAGAGQTEPLARPCPDDVALMLLSGGTTGLPKLIPRTHNDYVYNCRQAGATAGFDVDTVYLALLPIAHNYTLGCPGVLGALARGGAAVIATDTSLDSVARLIESERVSIIAAAVPLIVNWLNAPQPDRNLSSLRIVMNGGAKLAPELRRRVEERFGCTFQESFGTGEGLLNMTRLDDPAEIRFTSSGRPISPADEIRIVDEAGNDVADGVPGELICRGPYTIRGYYKAPDKNREAFTRDGFYRMGDLVRRVNGHLYVEGRLKDIINRGGEKISCEEVENHILSFPKVKNACVVAMPDPVFGEKACAFVIPLDQANFDLAELNRFLLGREIAKFKLPERLQLVPDFPTSPAGKILRRELRRMVSDELAREHAARMAS